MPAAAVATHAPIQFTFSRKELNDLAARHQGEFATATPFPHIVIPDFLPLDVATAIAAEFPSCQEPSWFIEGPGSTRHTGDKNIEKVSSSDEEFFPPLTRQVMKEFNSGIFLDFVGKLTGFQGLLPDPWFNGCGLHSTGRGGRLMIHADSSRHPNEKLHQLINMIYYVTPDWQPEWGGALELWDHETRKMVKSIPPTFNAMVMFYTGPRSYHGHPHPIKSPAGIRRNSLAVYYYSAHREKGDDYDGRQEQVKWIVTNAHDNNVSFKRRALRAVLRMIPRSLLDKAERTIRRVIQEG